MKYADWRGYGCCTFNTVSIYVYTSIVKLSSTQVSIRAQGGLRTNSKIYKSYIYTAKMEWE